MDKQSDSKVSFILTGFLIFVALLGTVSLPEFAYGGAIGNHMERGVFVEAVYPDEVAPDEEFAIRITLYNNNYYPMGNLTLSTTSDPSAIIPVDENYVTFESIGANSQLGEMMYFKVLSDAYAGVNLINFIYENGDSLGPPQKSFRLPLSIKENFGCWEHMLKWVYH